MFVIFAFRKTVVLEKPKHYLYTLQPVLFYWRKRNWFLINNLFRRKKSALRKETPQKNSETGENRMKEIQDEEQLNKIINVQEPVYVLFYATWCPFSQRFLPIYRRCTAKQSKKCVCIAIDDLPELCEKYEIEYYPTVICFEKGKVSKRLDPEPHGGLTEEELKTLLMP